jgi:hypothetical protein
MFDEFEKFDRAMSEIANKIFRNSYHVYAVMPVITLRGNGPKEKPVIKKDTFTDEEKAAIKAIIKEMDETKPVIVSPQTDSYHTSPVYGVIHDADYKDAIPLDINGHKVYMDYDDVKKLYIQLGPALKKYKKEHTE